MSITDSVRRAASEALQNYAMREGLNAMRAAFSVHDKTGRTSLTFKYAKVSDFVASIYSTDKVAIIIYTGRRAVTPLENRPNPYLKFSDGSFHKYSSAVKGDDYVSRAKAMLGG